MTIIEAQKLAPGTRVVWYKPMGAAKWKTVPGVFVRFTNPRCTVAVEDAEGEDGVKRISTDPENIDLAVSTPDQLVSGYQSRITEVRTIVSVRHTIVYDDGRVGTIEQVKRGQVTRGSGPYIADFSDDCADTLLKNYRIKLRCEVAPI